MIKIAHIADTHLRSRQYDSSTRGQDFFIGMQNAVLKAIKHKVDAILCAGDVIDSVRPSAEVIVSHLCAINEVLRQADTTMYVIAGNHDNTTPHWCAAYSHMRVLDCETVSIGTDKEQITIHGIPWMRRDAIMTYLETAPAANICMWHGEVEGFGFFTPNGIPTSAFPENRWQLIALGDLHVHEKQVRETDGTVFAYPGSTEQCSASEDPLKQIYIHTFTDGNYTASESVPFATRAVRYIEVKSEADVPLALQELRKDTLHYVRHSDIPNISGRFYSTLPENAILVFTARKTQQASTWKADTASVLSPSQFAEQQLATILPDEEQRTRLGSLLVGLLDPKADAQALIDAHCSSALQTLII